MVRTLRVQCRGFCPFDSSLSNTPHAISQLALLSCLQNRSQIQLLHIPPPHQASITSQLLTELPLPLTRPWVYSLHNCQSKLLKWKVKSQNVPPQNPPMAYHSKEIRSQKSPSDLTYKARIILSPWLRLQLPLLLLSCPCDIPATVAFFMCLEHAASLEHCSFHSISAWLKIHFWGLTFQTTPAKAAHG